MSSVSRGRSARGSGTWCEMFLFEGVAYDIVAAAVGALIGIAVAYVMVLVMASAFNQSRAASTSPTRSRRAP